MPSEQGDQSPPKKEGGDEDMREESAHDPAGGVGDMSDYGQPTQEEIHDSSPISEEDPSGTEEA